MRRREFICTTFAASLAGCFFGWPKSVLPAEKDRISTVVKAKFASAKDGNDITLLQSLLDQALEKLTGLSATAAWKTFCKPEDVVGLKVNALAGKGLSTHQILVEAICRRLQEIGVPPGRILIFDRMDRDLQRAGYTIATNKNGVQCYGNDRAGFDDRIYEFGRAGSRISRIVTDTCSVIINLPVLKDHGIVGISGGLKNLFGLIDNPNKYHTNVGDPYVADVAMLQPIRDKVRLTICDALTAQYEGGPPYMPQWCWPMNMILVATDMVALDQIIWNIIEAKRREKKLPSLKQAGREPTYIATAADAEHRLGRNDLSRIKVIEI